MKKVLLIGATGNIGMRIKSYLCKKSLSLYSPLSSEFDLKDRNSIHNYMESISVDGTMCFDWRKRSMSTHSERSNPPTFEPENGLKTA